MTVSEGVSVAHTFRNDATEPSTSRSSLSRISSRLFQSMLSLATFIPLQGAYGGQLDHLVQLISTYTALYYATIVSTECYSESIFAGVIVHRFLLLELARAGKKTIWLRLDRRRSKMVNTSQFLQSGGSTVANDTVRIHPFQSIGLGLRSSLQIQLSSSKEALFLKKARHENRQTFASPPALSDFNRILAVIIEKLSTYELWPVRHE